MEETLGSKLDLQRLSQCLFLCSFSSDVSLISWFRRPPLQRKIRRSNPVCAVGFSFSWRGGGGEGGVGVESSQ